MGEVRNLVKMFAGTSGMSISSTNGLIPFRTNVYKRPGGSYQPMSTFGNSSGIIKVVNREIQTFYRIIDECRSMESYDLSENIMKLILNSIISLVDDTNDFCHIKNDLDKTKAVNKILKDNGLIKLAKESIPDVVFYGSTSYFMRRIIDRKNAAKPEVKIKIFDLKNPYSTLIRKDEGNITYIIKDEEQTEVNKNSILYIGAGDFKLVTPEEDYEIIEDADTGETLKISSARYYGSRPILFTVTQKVKDYLLKDILTSVMSLKDAIQQTFLTVNMDVNRYASVTAEMDQTASTVESLINRSSDDAITIGEIMQIDVLVNRILSNVRILPDPGGTLAGLNALNLDEVKDKVNRLKEGREDLRDAILEAVGIPKDLYDGSSTAAEAAQKNDRLEAAIAKLIYSLKEAFKELIVKYCNVHSPELKLQVDDIIITFFRKSSLEFNRDQREMDALKESMTTATEILNAVSETIENNQFIDPASYFDFIRTSLSGISKDIGGLIKKDVKFDTPK